MLKEIKKATNERSDGMALTANPRNGVMKVNEWDAFHTARLQSAPPLSMIRSRRLLENRWNYLLERQV